MRLVHTELSKPQRALRAFLNTDDVPKGFKGNQIQVDGIIAEHSLTTFNLSRYVYARGFHEEALSLLLEHTTENQGMTMVFTDLKHPLSVEVIQALCRLLDIWENEDQEQFTEKSYDFFEKLEPVRSNLQKLNDDIMDRANIILFELLTDLIKNAEITALRMLGHDSSSEFIRRVRETGLYFLACTIGLEELDKKYPDLGALDEKERWALLSVKFFFHISQLVELWDYCGGKEDFIGRIIFSRQEQQAWKWVRKHLFTDLDYYTLLDALRMRSVGIIDQPKMDKFLKIHRKYGKKFDFSFDGQEYITEVSPFAEKPVCGPVSDLDLVLYPKSETIRKALALIHDFSFEHADGALAFAAISFRKNAMLLEEIQTDIPDLFRRLRLHETDATILRSVADAEHVLTSLLESWPKIILDAVKAFAKMHGLDRLYGSTPWRINDRYDGIIHPDKATAVYFNLMQKLGGQLVHDEKGELGIPQYYWQFDV